jgi:hydrogenase nickel incorporation protein HypA/HybF
MHELSVMTQIVESLHKELSGKGVLKVESVRLEIGELTMLSKDPLLFAWEILTEKGPLKGSKLIIVKRAAKVECLKCGFKGNAVHPSRLASHFGMPLIACPKCNGEIKIISGKECIIRSVRARVRGKTAKGTGMKGIDKRDDTKAQRGAPHRRIAGRTGANRKMMRTGKK